MIAIETRVATVDKFKKTKKRTLTELKRLFSVLAGGSYSELVNSFFGLSLRKRNVRTQTFSNNIFLN